MAPGAGESAAPSASRDFRRTPGETCIYTVRPPPRIDLTECKGCLCLDARRRARALTRLYEEKLRPHGLRATQFSVLAALALKGPTRLTDLADFLVLDRTTLTRVAARLAVAGWLDDAPSDDLRERVLRLTPVGRRKLEAAFPAWKAAQALAEERFPDPPPGAPA